MGEFISGRSLLEAGLILGTAFVTSTLMTPICRRIALMRNIVDRPDDWLKPHKQPIPYLGGVAIFLGWSVALLVAVALRGDRGAGGLNIPLVLAVVAAGTLVMGIGLFDDLHLSSPLTRLLGTALIGGLLILYGVGEESARAILNFRGSGDSWPPPWLLVVSIPLSLFVILGACNATNMLDGLDGLCSGVVAVAAAGFVALELVSSARTGDSPEAVRLLLALALVGATLGFLPYNRHPASIFMGDAGSTLLGLGSSILILLFADEGHPELALGAVVVFGLPVADMSLTLVRRWRNRRPLMRGDRSHYYDQLVDRGLSVRGVARMSYALGTGYAMLGCGISLLSAGAAMLAFAGVVLATAIVIAAARMVRIDASPPTEADHSARSSST